MRAWQVMAAVKLGLAVPVPRQRVALRITVSFPFFSGKFSAVSPDDRNSFDLRARTPGARPPNLALDARVIRRNRPDRFQIIVGERVLRAAPEK